MPPRRPPPPVGDRVFGEPGVMTQGDPPFVPEDARLLWLFGLNRFGMRPGLERVEALLAELGRPERALRTVVVAGTNGKGSTTRMLAALLGAAGQRVACFTSPHLLSVHERLEIDGQPCAADLFFETAQRLRPAVKRHGASWFETLTAMALDICRRAEVEILCCEAGLGGRLDASNALPAVATVITGVGLDHQEILGETLEAIAAEKLGLLKAGAPLFCAVPAGLKPQVFAAAVTAGTRAWFLDEQATVTERPDGTWDLSTRRRATCGLPPLPAPWLRQNAALALLCLEELAAGGVVRGPANPAAALAGAFLPGRHQLVLERPDWIFDTAHNGQALRASLATFLARPGGGRKLVLFGSLREKSLGEGVGELLRRCDRVVAAPPRLPRARDARELAALLRSWGVGEAAGPEVAFSVAEGIARLASGLRPDDAVLVTGSGFLVAEALWRLGYRDVRQTRPPRPAAEVLRELPGAAGGPSVEREAR